LCFFAASTGDSDAANAAFYVNHGTAHFSLEKFDVEMADTPSVVISKTTLPAKPKVLVLPGR
jgi:hypothetical protein